MAARRGPLRRAVGALGFWVVLSAVLLLFLYPILYAFLTSLKPPRLAQAAVPAYLFAPTLEHYRSLFVTNDFGRFFLNSTLVSLASVGLALVVGVPAAYTLSRLEFRTKRLLLLWILTTRILPPLGTAIPFYVFFTKVRMLDTIWPLIIVFLTFNISFVIWVMMVFFDQVPRTLDEAARIDGCSTTGAFLRVVMPVTAPGLASVAIFVFLFSWNNFFYPLVLTHSRAVTVPLALTIFLGFYVVDWGAIMAGTCLLILPQLVVTVVLRRHLVKGLGQGAVVG
jgi:multiple sugar transport system permease protein